MGKANCTFPFCEEPDDKERDARLCTRHAERWLRSEAFRTACRDEKVVFWMSLGAKEKALKEVAKHRRRWAKAEAAREEEGA